MEQAKINNLSPWIKKSSNYWRFSSQASSGLSAIGLRAKINCDNMWCVDAIFPKNDNFINAIWTSYQYIYVIDEDNFPLFEDVNIGMQIIDELISKCNKQLGFI